MLHFFLDISIQKPLEFQLVRPLSSLVKHIVMEFYKSNLPVLARKNQLPIHWMLLVLNITLNTKLFPSPQKRFHLRRLFLQSLTWRFYTLVHLTLPRTCHNIKERVRVRGISDSSVYHCLQKDLLSVHFSNEHYPSLDNIILTYFHLLALMTSQ